MKFQEIYYRKKRGSEAILPRKIKIKIYIDREREREGKAD
jgi:hypothetical protein